MGDDVAKIRDEGRPRVLNAVAAAMRDGDGLFDPGFIERVAAESAVDREVLIARWGTGPSLVADVVSENAVATPGWPDADELSGGSRGVVLAALVSSVTSALHDDQFTRTGLSQAIAHPRVRQVWSDFVRDGLDQWTEILVNAEPGPHDPEERDRAAQAVTLVAGQCYSSYLFGDAAPRVPNERIIELALSLLRPETS